MIFDDVFIATLILCEKEFVDPLPKDYKEVNGHYKKNFTLQSIDGKYNFQGFIRYNVKFNENFSVGFIFNPKEEKGTIPLLRCNGPSGQTKPIHHIHCHIHYATADTINSDKKPESNVELTSEYATLDQAILYFFKRINLTQYHKNKYIPDLPQPKLLEYD
jgi:hypothetical protein